MTREPGDLPVVKGILPAPKGEVSPAACTEVVMAAPIHKNASIHKSASDVLSITLIAAIQNSFCGLDNLLCSNRWFGRFGRGEDMRGFNGFPFY